MTVAFAADFENVWFVVMVVKEVCDEIFLIIDAQNSFVGVLLRVREKRNNVFQKRLMIISLSHRCIVSYIFAECNYMNY